MNRIARHKNERRIKAKRERILNYIRSILFVLGFVSLIYNTRTYNFTFMELKTILFIGLLPAFLCAILLRVKLKEYGLVLFLWGSFFVGAFFFINSFWAEHPVKVKLNISDRGNGGFRSSPTVTVEYDGVEKNIYVFTNNKQLLSNAPYLLVTIRKGYWGYYTIDSRELVMR